jgi:sugar phosphate isomerase/epimerase
MAYWRAYNFVGGGSGGIHFRGLGMVLAHWETWLVYKNFSPQALGVLGRQSEMIEYALTYGFRGLDVDMNDIVTRTQRKDLDYAARYLKAADILRTGFEAPIQLGADEAAFTTAFAKLVNMLQLAGQLEVKRAYIELPNASETQSYPELFDLCRERLSKIAEVAGRNDVRIGVGFRAGVDEKMKGTPFIRDVESFMALMRSIKSPHVGYIMDSWSWFVGHGGKDQLSEITGSEVVCVRLADAAGSEDPSTMKYFDRDLPSMRGGIDHVRFLILLKNAGYAGPVSVFPHAITMRGRTREVIVRAAQEAIDEILHAAGVVVPPKPMDLVHERQDAELEAPPVATQA